jgi:hypothetical protein
MNKPLSYTDRAYFLALVADLAEGDEIAEATVALAIEMTAGTPAPWADTDPQATEHWLLVHGANPQKAAAEAARFELLMRALVGVSLGRPVETFAEIATWLTRIIGGEL